MIIHDRFPHAAFSWFPQIPIPQAKDQLAIGRRYLVRVFKIVQVFFRLRPYLKCCPIGCYVFGAAQPQTISSKHANMDVLVLVLYLCWNIS